MLTSPRAVREISHSSVLAERGRLIAFPNRPLEKSGVEPLTLRHTWRPRTSFRLDRAFSYLEVCLRRKYKTAARIAGPVIILCALPGFASAQDATWSGTGSDNLWNNSANWISTPPPPAVPGATGTATFGAGSPTSISTLGGVSVGTLEFNAPAYTFETLGLTINSNGVVSALANAPTFNVIGGPGGVGTPSMVFNGSSSAGPAQIVLGQAVDTNMGFNAGFLFFRGTSTAGQATITTRDASNTEFQDSSTAGTATITADPGGSIFFENASSADHATITMLSGSSRTEFLSSFFWRWHGYGRRRHDH